MVGVVKARADGREQRFVSGDREPYVARSVDHRHFNFALKLPRGQSVRTLLRVQTESSVQVPIAIYSDHAFLETHQRSQLGLGVYYGVLIGLLLYNLLLFTSVRDPAYLVYVLFAAGMATQGLVPFCNIYSSFMQRAYDMIIHDMAIQQLLDSRAITGKDAYRKAMNKARFEQFREAG